jgi:hypothetical protein
MRFSFRSKPTYDTWHGGHPPCHFHSSANDHQGSLTVIGRRLVWSQKLFECR